MASKEEGSNETYLGFEHPSRFLLGRRFQMEETNFTNTEVLSIELTHETKFALLRMAKNWGLKTPEQMAANLILMAVKDFKRIRRQ